MRTLRPFFALATLAASACLASSGGDLGPEAPPQSADPYPWLERTPPAEDAEGARDAAPAPRAERGGAVAETSFGAVEMTVREGRTEVFARGPDGRETAPGGRALAAEITPYGGGTQRVEFAAEEDRWAAPFAPNGPGFQASLYLSTAFDTEKIDLLYDPEGVLAAYGFTERLLTRDHPGFAPFRAEWGRRLTATLGCAACHAVPASALASPERTGAPALPSDRPPDWLLAYLKAPRPLRSAAPGRMPDYGFEEADARALIAYLASLGGSDAAGGLGEGDPERGRALAAERSCAGCHAIPGLEAPPPSAAPLTDRRHAAATAAALVGAGHAPRLPLYAGEASAIAAYLAAEAR